jgi:hypothetical protein
MSTEQNPNCCGGCGETDGNKRCIGCMHPFSTAPTPSVRTDELALAAAGEIMTQFSNDGASLYGLNTMQLQARVQCIVQRAIEAGQPARQVNDDNTDRKADEIMTRGYQLTGYVLRHPETQHRAIIESSAVRWVQAADMAKIMFPQNRQPRQPLTDERIRVLAREHESYGFGRGDNSPDAKDFNGFDTDSLRAFARAIEAEINKATT